MEESPTWDDLTCAWDEFLCRSGTITCNWKNLQSTIDYNNEKIETILNDP